MVTYLGPKSLLLDVASLIRRDVADVIYLNSFHSLGFTFWPLVAARLFAPNVPILIAPRGEFAMAALAYKKYQKILYRYVVLACGLLKNVHFQASTDSEANDIRRAFNRKVEISIAPDLAYTWGALGPRKNKKIIGRVRLIFLGRIAPIKNILWLLENISDVDFNIDLDIVGPIEDVSYKMRCDEAVTRLSKKVTVRFLGAFPHDSVGQMLVEADALILPSLGENYGQVVPEALCAGCPVIVSDQTPWGNVTASGAGWHLPLGHPRLWLEALRELSQMDEPQHAVFRTAARRLGMEISADPTAVLANFHLFDMLSDAPRARGPAR